MCCIRGICILAPGANVSANLIFHSVENRADSRNRAKDPHLRIEDLVLLKQNRRNKLNLPWDRVLYYGSGHKKILRACSYGQKLSRLPRKHFDKFTNEISPCYEII